MVGLFGLVRFLVERRKGQEFVSRLGLGYPDATFGILRFGALRDQIAELGGDVSGWDWMILAGVTTGREGVSVWGGRANAPHRMVLLPWELISKVEQVDVAVRARFLPGIRLTVDSSGTKSVPIEFAPVSFRERSFRPLDDAELRRHMARMQEETRKTAKSGLEHT